MKIKVGLLLVFLFACSAPGGINWKAVWLNSPYNPVTLEPGAIQKFTVMGLNGADVTADLTRNASLKMISLDPGVVEVDQVNSQLIGRSAGETELRISFSEATSLTHVFVRKPERK